MKRPAVVDFSLERFELRVVLVAAVLAFGCGREREEALPPDEFDALRGQPVRSEEPRSIPPAEEPRFIPPAEEAHSAPLATEIRTVEALGFEMVLIPAGPFMMGSPDTEDARGDDEALHSVRLTRDFYISTKEISQAQWEAVMETNPSATQEADLPVEGVNWFYAAEFANRLSVAAGYEPAYIMRGRGVSWDQTADGYRLPTEAEWEYAARAGTSSPYSHAGFGADSLADDIPDSLVAEKLHDIRSLNPTLERTHTITPTRPVGSAGPNPWGLYDVHGNVGEWCWDWYGSYPSEEAVNPTGPDWARHRVIRGWGDRPGTRSAHRFQNVPILGLRVGVRLVRFVSGSNPDTLRAPSEPLPEDRKMAQDRCLRLFEVVMACNPEGPAMFVEERAAVMDFDLDGFPDRASLFGDRLDRHGHAALVDSLISFYEDRPRMFMMDIQKRCEKFAGRGLEPEGTAARPTSEATFLAIEAVEDCFALPCAERIPCIRPFVSATIIH